MSKGITITINGKNYVIEYSLKHDYHIIGINDRPFNAIKNKTKTIEARTNTPYSPFDYFQIKPGHIIEFINEATGESLITRVNRVTKYHDARELLVHEGTKKVLSSGAELEQGVKNLQNLTGYEQSIPKYGILAIEVEVE